MCCCDIIGIGCENSGGVVVNGICCCMKSCCFLDSRCVGKCLCSDMGVCGYCGN